MGMNSKRALTPTSVATSTVIAVRKLVVDDIGVTARLTVPAME